MAWHGVCGVLLVGLVLTSTVALAQVEPLQQAIQDYGLENYEEALQALEALQTDQENAEVSYFLGLTLQQMGQNSESRTHLETAYRLGARDQQLFVSLAETSLALEEAPAALNWLDQAAKEGFQGGELAYLRGLALARQKDYAEALDALEVAKEGDGKFNAQADYLRAQVFVAQNEYAQAAEALQNVIRAVPESDLAQAAQEYNRQFAQWDKDQRIWRGSLQLGYLYDSNAIAEPEQGFANAPVADDEAFTSRFRIDFPASQSGKWLLAARYNMDARTYRDAKTSNQNLQYISVSPGYRFQRATVTLPLRFTYQIRAGEEDQQSYAITPTVNLAVSDHQVAQFSAEYSNRMILFDYANVQTEELESREGDILTLSAGYYYLFAKGRGMLGGRYAFTDEDTDGKHWVQRGHKVSLTALVPLAKTVSLDMYAEYHAQDFKERNVIFDQERSDDGIMGSIGASWEFSSQTWLFARYQYFQNDSELYLYEYKREVSTLGIEFGF